MKKLVSLAMLITVISFVAGVALAATEAAPAAVDLSASLTGFLQGTVFPFITALVLGFLTLLLRKVAAKYHLDWLLKQEELLERVAYRGITLAEEKAAQYAGSKVALSGRGKMTIAVAHIMDAMPKIGEDKARDVVNALLAQIPGAGATGDTALPKPGDGVFFGATATLEPIKSAPVPAAP